MGGRVVISRITTFAFEGVEARPVDVQVQLSGGSNNFAIVSLPDKSVRESQDRVRAAFQSLGLLDSVPADGRWRGGDLRAPTGMYVIRRVSSS
jgi:hypothetical protein